MSLPPIVAFTGLPMSGKSTARSVLQAELQQRQASPVHIQLGVVSEVARYDREGRWEGEQQRWTVAQKEQFLRESARQTHGMDAMVMYVLDEIRAALNTPSTTVLIDNLYSYEEAERLRREFGAAALLVIAVTADKSVRIARGTQRAERPLTPDELASRDVAEVFNLNKGATIALADITIVNNYPTTPDGENALRHEIVRRLLAID